MSLELMKQALEALERGETKLRYEAITALRAAIEQTHGDWDEVEALQASLREHMVEIHRLRAAIEQAQEPVAFDHGIGIDRFKVVRGAFWWHVLIGDSPTEHGKFRSRAGAEKMAADLLREFRNGAFVQHTTPRQWQGLTDDEITEAGHLNVEGERMLPYSFARAIEAKLRERNHD
jgi:hypothetical protein